MGCSVILPGQHVATVADLAAQNLRNQVNRRLLPQRIVTLYDAHRFISRVLDASDVVPDELLDEDEAAAEEEERPRDGVLRMKQSLCKLEGTSEIIFL